MGCHLKSLVMRLGSEPLVTAVGLAVVGLVADNYPVEALVVAAVLAGTVAGLVVVVVDTAAVVLAVVEPDFDSVLHYRLAYYLAFAFQTPVFLLCIDLRRFDLAIFEFVTCLR
jgi:hypothetical protein